MSEEKPGKEQELWEMVQESFLSGKMSFSEQEEEEAALILNSLDTDRYHFDKEEQIAVGGEKVLNTAYDKHGDRTVVIARPRKHASISEKEEFLREARLTSKLQHPNIMPVYEIGLDNSSVPYFVMRKIRGKDMEVIVRDRKDTLEGNFLEEQMAVFLKVCDAVKYAHSNGVLHLDLKPSNIMIGRFGQVTLIDWGMAQVQSHERSARLTEEFSQDQLNSVNLMGTVQGTPGYMAPEQIIQDGKVNVTTDVYSLGAILYYILTGTIPGEGISAAEVMKNTREGKVIPPASRKGPVNLSNSLGLIAMKALSLRPEDRYRSVEALQEDILRYQHGFAPAVEKASILKRSQLLVKRHNRVATALMGAGTVILVMVIGWLIRERAYIEEVESARAEAESNLELFLEEHEVARKFHEDLLGGTMSTSLLTMINMYPYSYDFLVKEFEDTEFGTEKRNRLQLLIGSMAMADQHFSEAAEFLEGSARELNYFDEMYQYARKWALLKPDDSSRLTDDQFAEFVDAYPVYRQIARIVELAYRLHVEKRESSTPESHFKVVLTLLNFINHTPAWGKQLQLEPCEGGYHLDLRGAPYVRLNTEKMIDPYVDYISDMNLVSLDISGVQIRELLSTYHLRHIDTLIMLDMDSGQLNRLVRSLLDHREINNRQIVLREGNLKESLLARLRQRTSVTLLAPGDKFDH